MLGPCCHVGLFLVAASGRLLLVDWLLLLWSMGPRAPRLQRWQSMGSVAEPPGSHFPGTHRTESWASWVPHKVVWSGGPSAYQWRWQLYCVSVGVCTRWPCMQKSKFDEMADGLSSNRKISSEINFFLLSASPSERCYSSWDPFSFHSLLQSLKFCRFFSASFHVYSSDKISKSKIVLLDCKDKQILLKSDFPKVLNSFMFSL